MMRGLKLGVGLDRERSNEFRLHCIKFCKAGNGFDNLGEVPLSLDC